MLAVRHLLPLAFGLSLSACAYQGYEPPPPAPAPPPSAQYAPTSPPPGAQRSFTYGTNERQLGPNRFEITYAGPIRNVPGGYNERQPYLDQAKRQAEDYALLRAAQIAQANGRRYFIVVSRRADIELGSPGLGDVDPAAPVGAQLASADPSIGDGTPVRQEARRHFRPRVGICVGCGSYPFWRPWYRYSYQPHYWRPTIYTYWHPFPYWNPYWDAYPRVNVWRPYPAPYAVYPPNQTARAIAVLTVTLVNTPIQNAFDAAQTEAQIKEQYGLQ